jgi:hypothetical protein
MGSEKPRAAEKGWSRILADGRMILGDTSEDGIAERCLEGLLTWARV